MNEIHPELKKLQNLFSWSSFYRDNLFRSTYNNPNPSTIQASYIKTQEQIAAQREVLNSTKEVITKADEQN